MKCRKQNCKDLFDECSLENLYFIMCKSGTFPLNKHHGFVSEN